MIVDSHLHLWVQDPDNYPWVPIGGYIPENEAPLAQFLDVMTANGVEGAVLVQPTPYGWDNAYLLDCKKTDPHKFKAVVLADPFAENSAQKLHHLKACGADGLRINLHLQPLRHWDCKSFHHLWEACTDLQLPVCLQLTPDYLGFVHQLADAYQIPVILDHLGRPEPGSKMGDENFQQLLALSDLSNIFIKLSGLYYYSQQEAPFRDTWDLLRTVKKVFGADHCMWGSDFPFIEDHWSYHSILDVVRNALDFTQEELLCILGKTSASIWWPAV